MHEIKLWGQQDEAFGVQRQKCRVSAAQRGNEMSLCSPFSVKTDGKGEKRKQAQEKDKFSSPFNLQGGGCPQSVCHQPVQPLDPHIDLILRSGCGKCTGEVGRRDTEADHQPKPLGTIPRTLYPLFLASSPFW